MAGKGAKRSAVIVVEDEGHERRYEPACGIDVAKASGVVCTRSGRSRAGEQPQLWWSASWARPAPCADLTREQQCPGRLAAVWGWLRGRLSRCRVLRLVRGGR